MHEDAHCSNNNYCKEKLEKPEHLHRVYHMFREFPRIEFQVVNKNAKQKAWIATRKIQGKIKNVSLFEIINL